MQYMEKKKDVILSQFLNSAKRKIGCGDFADETMKIATYNTMLINVLYAFIVLSYLVTRALVSLFLILS